MFYPIIPSDTSLEKVSVESSQRGKLNDSIPQKKIRAKQIIIISHRIHGPCMVYLPTFGWSLWFSCIGKNIPVPWILWVWHLRHYYHGIPKQISQISIVLSPPQLGNFDKIPCDFFFRLQNPNLNTKAKGGIQKNQGEQILRQAFGQVVVCFFWKLLFFHGDPTAFNLFSMESGYFELL